VTVTDTARPTSYYMPGEHPNPENEMFRLRQQVAASWPKELRLLQDLGLRPTDDVTEIGSGPGFVSELLLDAVPQGSLTCLELDRGLHEYAASHLPDTPRLRLVHQDLLAGDVAPASADLVHARLVLQHVPHTEQALATIDELLRPGGRLVVIDVDDTNWGSLHPIVDTEAVQDVVRLRIELQDSRGGNRHIARDLPALLRAAGYQDIRVDAIAVSSDEVGLEVLAPQLNIRSRTAAMVAANPAAAEPCRRFAEEMDAFLARPDAQIVVLMFAVSATKPGAR
jgi:ubiquinone/menaquinone biosynthesis C-methylase UbiE